MLCSVYNKIDFDDLCLSNGWNDDNRPADTAFISICCSKDCEMYWNGWTEEDNNRHWFEKEAGNVINLEFDDVTHFTEFLCHDDEKGKIYAHGISDEDAKRLHDFIWRNQGKNFIIHCRAGMSRSQAVCRYITDVFEGYETRVENPCRYPNIFVLNKLHRLDY